MSAMCTKNAIDVSKCATGKDAVEWAKTREHDKLEAYCAQDVLVLFTLTRHGQRHGLVVPLWGNAPSLRLELDARLKVSMQTSARRAHAGPVAALLA